MAIPFYDPKVNNTNNNNNNNNNSMGQENNNGSGDQVDGFTNHTNANYVITMPEISIYDANGTTINSNASNTNLPDFLASTPTDDEIMPWKLLALTMCKILKTYYQQHLNANNLHNNSNTNSSEFLNNLSNNHPATSSWQM